MRVAEELELEPGRRLDCAIALRIFGVKEITVVGDHYFTEGDIKKQVKRYSTDMTAAMEIVEKLSRGNTDCSFVLEFHYMRYHAIFGKVPTRPTRFDMYETAPEAICKAALKLLEQEEATA